MDGLITFSEDRLSELAKSEVYFMAIEVAFHLPGLSAESLLYVVSMRHPSDGIPLRIE